MLDETGKKNFFENIHNLWIQPELNRRFGTTGIPTDFKIWECLIRLPPNQAPVVEFNDEVGWEVNFKAAPGVNIDSEQLVYLHDVEHTGQALPPTIEGKRVAFVYLYWSGYSYHIAFDFAPNHPDFDPSSDEFHLGSTIGEHIRNKSIEMVVKLTKNVEPQLRSIGLWPVTCLLPYPISKIVERVGAGYIEEARAILIKHCNPEFVDGLVQTWMPIAVYKSRMVAFNETVFAHRNAKYHLSISTLVPHVEGVITDWLYQIIPEGETVRWSEASKIKQFSELVMTIPDFELSYRDALLTVTAFLSEENHPFMKVFRNWLETIDPSFPNRHIIAHGRYDEEMYTEENSIKLFLLLDTICQFMIFYEARSLGRDFNQYIGDGNSSQLTFT